MAKEILYFDEPRYYREMNEIKEGVQYYQMLFDEFLRLQLPLKITSMLDVVELAAGGEDFIKSRLQNSIEQPKILGIPISRKKAVEMMELPDFAELNKLTGYCAHLIRFGEFYELQGTKISVAKNADEALRARYCLFADTTEKKEILAAYKNASDSLNKLNNLLVKHTKSFIMGQEAFNRVFHFDKLTIKPYNHFFEGVAFVTENKSEYHV